MSQYHIDTNCIHAGYTPGDGEPRVVPIVQSTTYKYDHAETLGKLFDLEQDGFFYTRLANPTLDAVEKKIAALEGGVGALLTSSGQAASLISVLNICRAGGHVVCSSAIYGGTFNLFYKTMHEMGIDFTFGFPGKHRRRAECSLPAEYALCLCRDALQSGLDCDRSGAVRKSSACPWLAADCGQHLCHPDQLPPV